jgi:coniferyl-aldehyde dehydrogenase
MLFAAIMDTAASTGIQTPTASTRSVAAAPKASEMAALLDRQRTAQLAEGPPPAEVRIDRIDRLINAVVTNRDALVDALSDDYGHRSSVQSTVSDVVGVLPTIKHTRAHVRAWMKPTKRSPGQLRMLGAKAWIEWQPLGVIGVISPWNFPV